MCGPPKPGLALLGDCFQSGAIRETISGPHNAWPGGGFGVHAIRGFHTSSTIHLLRPPLVHPAALLCGAECALCVPMMLAAVSRGGVRAIAGGWTSSQARCRPQNLLSTACLPLTANLPGGRPYRQPQKSPSQLPLPSCLLPEASQPRPRPPP